MKVFLLLPVFGVEWMLGEGKDHYALILQLHHEGHEEHEGFQGQTSVGILTLRVIRALAGLAFISLFFFVFLRALHALRGQLRFSGLMKRACIIACSASLALGLAGGA
jgi:hypothetical protein